MQRTLKKNKKGFTLIEVIVAASLFIIVITISTSTLVSVIDANAKAQSLSNVMTNLNFALQDMLRLIRNGHTYQCDVTPCTDAKIFTFTHTEGGGSPTTYRYEYDSTNKTIKKSINGGPASNIVASGVVIDHLSFYMSGALATDGEQPRLLIVLRGYAGEKDRIRSNFTIQTLVSRYDIDKP